MVIENMVTVVTSIYKGVGRVAIKIIKIFKLKNNSKILDVGWWKSICFMKLKKLLPEIKFLDLIYQDMQ